MTLLSKEVLAEIEARNQLDYCRFEISKAIPGICYRPAGHSGAHSNSMPSDDSFAVNPDISALLAHCQALEAERETYQVHQRQSPTTDKPTIEEIREVLAKQTKEWFDIPHPEYENADHRISTKRDAHWAEFGHVATVNAQAAPFIANAPRYVDFLLEEVARLETANTELKTGGVRSGGAPFMRIPQVSPCAPRRR